MPDEPITIRGGSLIVHIGDSVLEHPSDNGKITSVEILDGGQLPQRIQVNDPKAMIIVHYEVPSPEQQAS